MGGKPRNPKWVNTPSDERLQEIFESLSPEDIEKLYERNWCEINTTTHTLAKELGCDPWHVYCLIVGFMAANGQDHRPKEKRE